MPQAHHLVRDANGAVLGYTPGTRSLVTDETVVEMERWAKAEQDHPLVREWAIDACASVDDCRTPGERAAKAIERVIRERVLYVSGPFNVQLVHTPGFLVGMARPSGNCVDMTTLACAMALSVGLNPAVVRVAFSGDPGPDPFEHVVCVIECRGIGGGVATIVLDSTVPEAEVDTLLRRATSTYVHEPVGRPAVESAGPWMKEAMTVVHAAPFAGNGSQSYIDGKANRCPCGSGRLAGVGGCSSCERGGPADRAGLGGMSIPIAGGIGGEIAADLSGMLDRPLSALLAYVADACDQVLRACPGRHGEDTFAWIHGCQNAAGAAASMIMTAEQNANAYRSPQAKHALAANVYGVLPVDSLIEWSRAALEALSHAAAACNIAGAAMQGRGAQPGAMGWGSRDPLGRAGLGAAGDALDRLVSALLPGDGWRVGVLRGAVRGALEGYDVTTLCNGDIPDGLIDAIAAVAPDAGITKDRIRGACVGILGAAPLLTHNHVPANLRNLINDRVAPFEPGAGPFEGDWTLNVSNGAVLGARLYDRDGWVIGPAWPISGSSFSGNFIFRRDGNAAKGNAHRADDDAYSPWNIALVGPGALEGQAPGTNITMTGAASGGFGYDGPPLPGPSASSGGIPGWAIAAAAGVVALVASQG